MGSSNKDDGALLRDFVCATGSNLSKEDVEQDGEEEGDKVIDLERHDSVLLLNERWLLRVNWVGCEAGDKGC